MWSQPLQFVKGVGPRRAAEFARVGLTTVEDLLLRFPRRYENRAGLTPIASLRPGQTATVVGEVLSSGVRTTRRPGFRLFEVVVRDASGAVRAVFPNQAFLKDVFRAHQQVVLYGLLEYRSGGLQFTNAEYEIVKGEVADGAEADDVTVHTGRIVPIYEKIGSVTTRMQRSLIFQLLNDFGVGEVRRSSAGAKADGVGGDGEDAGDPVPAGVRGTMPTRLDAVRAVHFPATGTDVEALNHFATDAHRRLIFEEFFLFQAGLVLRKRRAAADKKPRAVQVDDRIRDAARKVLPFQLTDGQKVALREIVTDMQRPEPMHRLLQGDVGAGKTIVALLAALVAMENGLQVAFMAPTEILADQHYLTIRRLLDASRFRVASLTGSLTAAKKRATLAEIASGTTHLVVGTHALVEGAVEFKDLGLVVIDEQHRFGVLQRATLREKGQKPDVLVMTATPIPRTLALTAFGDLDVSVIRGLPPGRQPIRTLAKPESRRDEVYQLVRRELEQGRQAYVIYPLVEESEKVDLKAATAMYDTLQQDIFPEYRVALLHGRMKADDKEQVMAAFARGDVHVLAATTVVEVGVDVANATVMVVEHAERFGLSQLHQLRGRVGRGAHESTCVLLYQFPISDQGRSRIDALVSSTDGFVIAERDLEIRGPGDFFGTRQSGLPTLRVGDLVRDHALMEDARRAAVAWLDNEVQARSLVTYLTAHWAERFGLVGVG